MLFHLSLIRCLSSILLGNLIGDLKKYKLSVNIHFQFRKINLKN